MTYHIQPSSLIFKFMTIAKVWFYCCCNNKNWILNLTTSLFLTRTSKYNGLISLLKLFFAFLCKWSEIYYNNYNKLLFSNKIFGHNQKIIISFFSGIRLLFLLIYTHSSSPSSSQIHNGVRICGQYKTMEIPRWKLHSKS